MQSPGSNYEEVISKLDAFIRKYYTNQLIRGAIYAFTLLLGFYLAVTLLESYAWFSTTVRSTFFYCYLLATGIVLWRLILIPLFKLYHLGKIISHTEAAKIIGEHFAHIKDKLLNTLQLHELASNQKEQLDLIYASINQKSAELRPIAFSSAIDFSKNKKYLKFAAIPALILLVVLIAAPSLITDSTKRLFNHSTTFSKPAPFQFTIQQKNLQVTQFNDFTVDVKMSGKEIPQEVFISIGENTFRLEKESTLNFHYTFKNVQSTTEFQFLADGYSSSNYILNVVPNPVVLNFSVQLDYPSYLGKKNEAVKNTGDLLVPAGTKITWNFGTQNTSTLKIHFPDSTFTLSNPDENNYQFERKILQSATYDIRTSNKFMESHDAMQYSIVVIPDQYPTIEVEQQQDSTSYQKMYFRGIARDDYGLSKIQFHYRFIKRESQDVNENVVSQNLPLNRTSTQEQFFHYWDMSAINLKPGDELEYYFEVWDNDGVHGPKSARSQSNVFKAPSLEELSKNNEQNNKALKDDLAESLKKAKDLQKEMNEINRDLMKKKNLEYEDRKKISDMLKSQKELEKKIEDIKKQNESNNKRKDEFRKEDPELAQKQQQLQELFEKLMTPEMKKIRDEMEKMMAQVDKQKVQEMMDKMKLDNKDMEKQLDRTLELFKQLELQQKVKESAEKLDQLSKDQDKLADKTDEKKSGDEEKLKEEQQDLNKKFDDLKKDLQDLEKKNEEMDFPQDMKDVSQDAEDIKKDMEDSEKQLGENQKKKSSKSQKSASKKMKELSEKMKKQQEKEEKEQQEEDEQALRALLQNLLRFSFDQESLMGEVKSVDINNPRYLKLAQDQRKLKDDAGVLEDSLLALSKRVVQISSAVNEQITDINANTEKALAFLQDRQVPQARSSQQFIMTAVNNLALMLSESLDKMQQQQQEQKDGDGSCKKPGKGKKPKPGPSAGDIKKMQEKLSQQLKDMKGKMDGKKPNGKESGQGEGMSEELAKMAAQQEALRDALQKLNQEDNKDGQGKLGDLNKIAQQMEENEKDIVNKRISDMTLNRQQEILTRLLESEKAEKEREQEQKRESTEGKEITRTPPQFEEYKQLKMRETELLKTIPPGFTTFYKNLVNSYFQSIEE